MFWGWILIMEITLTLRSIVGDAVSNLMCPFLRYHDDKSEFPYLLATKLSTQLWLAKTSFVKIIIQVIRV